MGWKKVELLLLIFVVCFGNYSAYGYMDEEWEVYEELYLQLPWEPAKHALLKQSNGDSYTHKVGSCDEYALDFALSTGTPVVTAAPGVVHCYYEGSTAAPAYGNHIKVDHGFFYTLYAHLSEINDNVCGREVLKGEVIGRSGNSGFSTGPHLHFGLYYGNAHDDGYSYSVRSKIIVANEGVGPYQFIESTNFNVGAYYLSGNFAAGKEGMIVCDGYNDCGIRPSDGMGGYDPGDSGTTPDGPDGNVKRVEVSDDGDHWHHSFLASPGQTLEIEVKVTNKGDEAIDYFEVFIHRSADLNFDEDSDHSYGREEEEDDIDPGESRTKHRTITVPMTPGTYYVFAYINRVDGENGGDDQDWSNNYSRDDDLEEYAVIEVVSAEDLKKQAAVLEIIGNFLLN